MNKKAVIDSKPDARKHKNYYHVLNSCMILEIEHGHLNWTMSQLSRLAKLPRSVLYYHYGNDRKELVFEAVRFFGKHLAGFDNDKLRLYSEKKYTDSIALSRKAFLNSPAIVLFYFLHRNSDGEVGDLIRYYEKLLLDKLKLFFPNCSEAEIEALSTIFLGISISPYIKDNNGISNVLKILKLAI